MEGLDARCRRPRIFLDPLYLRLGIRHRHATRATQHVKDLGNRNSQAMQQSSGDQTSTADASAAVDRNGGAGEQEAMQLFQDDGQLAHRFWSSTISNGERTKEEAMPLTKLRFGAELEFADFGRLKQRHDRADTRGLPSGDLSRKVLTAAGARRESEPMRLDAGYPVERGLEHAKGSNVRHERRPQASEACWRASARWRG